MISSTLLLAAVSAGLLGSPHCVGMCGGIVTAFGLSLRDQSSRRKWLLTLLYHLGRLLSYALLGLLAGMLGTALLAPLLHTPWPRLVVAAALLLIGLSMLGLPLLNRLEQLGAHLWQRMAPLRQRLFPLTSAPRVLAAGLLWGFLPCGLVYASLLTAAAAADPVHGAVLMLAFGLGTLPLLLVTGAASQTLAQRLRQWRPLMGVLLIGSGLWTAWMPLAGHGQHRGTADQGHLHPAGHTITAPGPVPAAAAMHHGQAGHVMPVEPALPAASAQSLDQPVTTTHHETHLGH